MTTQIATTEAVLGHHLQAIADQNIDAIVSDYTEDSIVISANGISRGLEQIRGFFSFALTVMTPEVLAVFQVARQEVDGEFAYMLWSAPPAIAFATDTFCIRDGKIVMQSFAAQFGS